MRQFKVGQKVWVLFNDTIKAYIVKEIEENTNTYKCIDFSNNLYLFKADMLFTTKKEIVTILIKKQAIKLGLEI